MDWFDKAAEELESELESGNITPEEFRFEMSNLRAELREHASEAAESAFNDVMGY